MVYASNVGRTARFWERLGFTRFYQLPADGEPGYVALRRGDAEVAVVAGEWARDQYGLAVGDGPRFEMFVYADDVDAAAAYLRQRGVSVLGEPVEVTGGPDAGERWVYFQTPWGMQMELTTCATGGFYDGLPGAD